MSSFSYLNVYLCSNGRLTEGCLSGIQLHTAELTHFVELKVWPGLAHFSIVSPSQNLWDLYWWSMEMGTMWYINQYCELLL